MKPWSTLTRLQNGRKTRTTSVYDLQNSMGEEQFLDTFLQRIIDFNPNEDVFTIEVDRNDETADISVEVELDQTQENGTYTSLITLTFVEEVNAT